ncbi:hypothetical protein BKA61DRAFT_481402 [Leptodontidium sp. MPI-SDFR-AT-0119]|nr:hypothetical protein BKA61DRAFT_481402 [Leptodontidium sp. MPI-SDFR-AT-0119]
MYIPFNKNDSLTTGWQEEPRTRGTWSIFFTCIITISLCVWAAVHLNVPEHGKQGRQWWRRFGWLIIGLFAPEVVVYIAWRQRNNADEIVELMRANRSSGEQAPMFYLIIFTAPRTIGDSRAILSHILTLSQNLDTRKNKWTRAHSHYALMGGFALDPRGDFDRPFNDSKMYKQLIVTPARIVFLAKYCPDAIPNISVNQINDQSKANGLAKLLICLQATWFCVQCITRLAFNISISLLELNTFAHAICALMLAYLWWHKPLDVGEPTLIPIRGKNEKDMEQLCVFMCMGSVLDYQEEFNLFRNQDDSLSHRKEDYERHVRQDGLLDLWEGETLYGFTLRASYRFIRLFDAVGPIDGRRPCLQLRPIDRTRWKLNRVPGFLTFAMNEDDWTLFCGMTIACAIYGGLHLVAWNAPFLTRLERLLWRISGLVIACFGAVYMLLLIYLVIKRRMVTQWDGTDDRLHWMVSAYMAVYLPLYLFSRVYLIVECFINLFHLPQSVFQTPNWSQYFPHIS